MGDLLHAAGTAARTSVRSDSRFVGADHEFIVGDCLRKLAVVPDESVHLVLTDPPCFLDGLDDKWVGGSRSVPAGVVGSLPPGMRFDPRQGRRLQNFMSALAPDLLRVLKPGGFALLFSQPRLAGRMGVALEDCAFEIRDMYAWRFTKKCQTKAAKQEHWIDRRPDWTDSEKREAKEKLGGRKTAQLRPNFESIIFAQKPNVKSREKLINSRHPPVRPAPVPVSRVDLEEDENDGCGRCGKPRSSRFSKLPVGALFASMGSGGVHSPGAGDRQCVRIA